MNFQMFKLVLEMAEEPEIKLPTSAGPSRLSGKLRGLVRGEGGNVISSGEWVDTMTQRSIRQGEDLLFQHGQSQIMLG